MHITTSESRTATRQDDPVSDVDTFAEAAANEQTMIETFNINFAGMTMNTETTTAVAEAMPGKIRSRHTYFDLFEWLDEKLTDPKLKARVFSSMAWMLDIFTINNARSIFFQMHEAARTDGIDLFGQETLAVDSYNEFLKYFSTHDIGDALLSSFYKGKLNDDGTVGAPDEFDAEVRDEQSSEPWRDMLLMVSMHNQWHAQAAQQLAVSRKVSELKRNYAIKTYEELAMDERVYVDTMAVEKLMALAAVIAPDNAEKVGGMFMKGREQAAKSRVASNKENARFVLAIIGEAQRRAPEVDDDHDVQFYDLSKPMQHKLSEQASKAIARSIEQMATDKSIPLLDYVGMAQLALKAQAELNVVIEEKFAQLEQ